MRSMGAAAVFDIEAAVPPIMKSTKKAVASVGLVLVILTEVLLGEKEDAYVLQESSAHINVVFRILPSW